MMDLRECDGRAKLQNYGGESVNSNQGPHHNARSGLIKFQTSKTKYFHRINHVMDLKREHTLYNIQCCFLSEMCQKLM